MEQHETHVGTLYRLTLDTGAQHLVSPQQLQGIDPATIVAQERFEQAHWRRDINDVDRLLALDAEGRWRTLEAVADDHWEDAAQPMAYSGEERQEAREQTGPRRWGAHLWIGCTTSASDCRGGCGVSGRTARRGWNDDAGRQRQEALPVCALNPAV